MARHLMRDNKGSFAVMTAILLPVFLGFVGLAMEIGSWYSARRAMQGAADAAAFSAAVAYTLKAPWQTEGLGVAAANGFTNGVNGITVAVNMPPTSPGSNFVGDPQAVEVVITQPSTPLFSRFVGFTVGPTIPARAVARVVANNSDCVLSLDPTAAGAVTVNGGTTINMPTCTIGDNSTSASAFTVKGSANVATAGNISVVGGDSLSGNPSISPAVQTGRAPILNPYAGLSVPLFNDPNKCTKGIKVNAGQTVILDPNDPSNPYASDVIPLAWPPGGVGSGNANAMVICGDITVSGLATLTLNPGVYILDGGSFNATGGIITGNGVTIILTSTSGANNIGTVSIGGTANVTLTADTSGPFPGFIFFQDPNAANAKKPPDASFLGNGSNSYNGALYFPGVNVTFGGASQAGATGCTQVIADTIQFSGNTNITNSGCSAMGLSPIGPTLLVQ